MPSAPQGHDRSAIEATQKERLRALADVLPSNRFYAAKLGGANLDHWTSLPFTTKAELLANQEAHPPYGQVLTFPRERYLRLCQTSGTSGSPLRWLDTRDSWNWMLDCWDSYFQMVGLRPDDRLFFPFSFGPFLGFWTAFEAGVRRGNFTLPGGGMSSAARIRFLLDHEATVVFCTPTYALRLAEVARADGIDLAGSAVRLLIVAGEPGGSIPATRGRIEASWGARVIDHSGMTEVGPAAIECQEGPGGLHILETDYRAEIVDGAGQPVPAGELGELVLTNLGRLGSPILRYRTGDLVKVDPKPCPCGSAFVRLEGGILGRTDDMIHLRGNNLHPSALEAIVLRFPEVAEYRVAVDRSGTLAALRIEVEPAPGQIGTDLAERIARAVRDELLFRAEVTTVAPGTLPRFEMKARRVQWT